MVFVGNDYSDNNSMAWEKVMPFSAIREARWEVVGVKWVIVCVYTKVDDMDFLGYTCIDAALKTWEKYSMEYAPLEFRLEWVGC